MRLITLPSLLLLGCFNGFNWGSGSGNSGGGWGGSGSNWGSSGSSGWTGPPDLGPSGPTPGPQPSFGPTVTQSTPPPPITGGTLLALSDGATAVASDPDRDQVYVVDLIAKKTLVALGMQAGDEPGRLVEDAAGRVHVALRRGGALMTLVRDKSTWAWSIRRPVCAAPRGLAYEPATDLVHVACSGGELVSLPAAGGNPQRTVQLDSDLRDVVFDGGTLKVSTFRSASLLTIDANGAIVAREQPGPTARNPDFAWRSIALPSGGVLMLHQLAAPGQISTQPGGWASFSATSCQSIVRPVLSVVGTTPSPQNVSPALPELTLVVDVAVSPDGKRAAVVAPGNAHTLALPTLAVFATDPKSWGVDTNGCVVSSSPRRPPGEPTAVSYTPAGTLLVQSREPAQLEILDPTLLQATVISLAADSRADTGHAVFHANSGGFIACASCHGEGGDDGQVWNFGGSQRRTMSLRGGLTGTTPFHWNGDIADLSSLIQIVYQGRMLGPTLAADQIATLSRFTDAIPVITPSPAVDLSAVARGQALFDGAAGCSGCHSGPHFTNNQTVDVGTGGSFQVPRLTGLWSHAPFLHDGCAATLADRFGACATKLHGNTASLSSSQVSDLVAYLSQL
jgi:hypothetical protein